MTCSSCKYLNENKKLDGKVSGCEYFCNKNKYFVNGQNNACNKYESSFRSTNIDVMKYIMKVKIFIMTFILLVIIYLFLL